MRRIEVCVLAMLVMCVAGCDLINGNNSPDLMPVADLLPPPDLMDPPDLTPVVKDSIALDWSLLTADLSAGTNNNFAIKCDDPKAQVTKMVFSVTSKSGVTRTTDVPCPAGADSGVATLRTPDTAGGTYDISAVCDGKPMSASDKIHAFQYGAGAVFVHVYVGGCDQANCM